MYGIEVELAFAKACSILKGCSAAFTLFQNTLEILSDLHVFK